MKKLKSSYIGLTILSISYSTLGLIMLFFPKKAMIWIIENMSSHEKIVYWIIVILGISWILKGVKFALAIKLKHITSQVYELVKEKFPDIKKIIKNDNINSNKKR